MILRVRPARMGEIDAIMGITAQARAAIATLGIDQWQDGYPERELIESDLVQGTAYVFTHPTSGEPLGYLALAPSPEPVYAQIDGAWHLQGDYLTIHRMCLGDAARGRGLGGQMLRFAEQTAGRNGFASVRADTHRGNGVMRHLLEKNGFTYCGIVRYPLTTCDPLRVAFEKAVSSEHNEDAQQSRQM